MIELKKAIKKVLEELKEKYKNGNRKALSEILLLIKKDVFDLLNHGLSIKMTKKIVENAIELEIKDDTFYKWVKRQKSNIKEEKIISKALSATNKNKEVKNETAEVKNINEKLKQLKQTDFNYNNNDMKNLL